MYTKKIVYKELIKNLKVWVQKELRVTDDSFWLHFQALSINNNVKEIIVVDI